MLRLNIQNAKEKGIQKMLMTCDERNIASERTIISNGGVFEKNIEVDGCVMKRYWIETNR
jgi:predicted acetyltransferase